MNLLELVTEDHMVAEFLRAELDSPDHRFVYRLERAKLGMSRAIVDSPDLTDNGANEARRRLLTGGRGYPATALFQNWPTGVEWWKAEVPRAELGSLRFIHDQPWLRLSEGTRLVKHGAANVGAIPQLDQISAKINTLAQRVREGYRFADLLVVAISEGGPIVIMEGNARAAAYVLAGRAGPDSIAAVAGYSPYLANWPFFGHP